MARTKTIDSFKKDNILFEFIKQHKGKHNIVTSKEISEFLGSKGIKIKAENVHSMIVRIMYERNAPICHINSKGYYWAINREEIEEAITDLEARRVAMQMRIEHLKSFILV